MLHLFNYGNNASSINAGFDFDNSTINTTYYSKTSDNCGMRFYGNADSSKFVRLKKTNNSGKKYIEILYGSGDSATSNVIKLVVRLQASSIPIGTIVTTDQQIQFKLHQNKFYRCMKLIGTTSFTDTLLYPSDYATYYPYSVISLAVDFDLGYVYVGYVMYSNGSYGNYNSGNNYSVIWVNDPASGIPTYTFTPNTDMCIEVNPYYATTGTQISSYIYAFENEYTRRVDPPTGYSYWNSIYNQKLKTTFLNSNGYIDLQVSSKYMDGSGYIVSLPVVFNTRNFKKLYYEMIVTGDIRLLSFRQDNFIHGYDGFIMFARHANNINLTINWGSTSLSNMGTGTVLTDSSVLYSDISSDLTGTNIIMFSIDLSDATFAKYRIGFNGNWTYGTWVRSYISTINGYRSLLYRHMYQIASPYNVSLTLKSKTGEFTYTPPSGFIGLDDNL